MHINLSPRDRLQAWCDARGYDLSWIQSSAAIELPGDSLRRALGVTFYRDGTFHASVYVTDSRPVRGRDHCFSRDYLDEPVTGLEQTLDRLADEASRVRSADLQYVRRSASG